MQDDKRIHVIEDLCTGCRLCQLICSVENMNVFNPKLSRIKVVHIDEQGVYIPVTDCNGSECLAKSGRSIPKCVAFCSSGALIYATVAQAAEMKSELIRNRAFQPIFRVIAPWKWPFPWRPWPFEENEKE